MDVVFAESIRSFIEEYEIALMKYPISKDRALQKKQEMIDEHKQYFIYGNLETEKKEVKRVCGGVANGYDEKKLVDYVENIKKKNLQKL